MNRSRIDVIVVLSALAMAATGTIARTGATIDLTLQDSPTDSMSFVCASNGGTALYSIEHSVDGSVWTSAAAFTVLDAAAGLAPASGVPIQLGYVGNQRYVRVIHGIPSATAFTAATGRLCLLNRTQAIRNLPA